MLRLLAAFVFAILMPSALAQESLRLERPAGAFSVSQPIFTAERTPIGDGAFERWRRTYCSPSVCNMVLCHGACANFVEHCPSFSESQQIVKLVRSGCMAPNLDESDCCH